MTKLAIPHPIPAREVAGRRRDLMAQEGGPGLLRGPHEGARGEKECRIIFQLNPVFSISQQEILIDEGKNYYPKYEI